MLNSRFFKVVSSFLIISTHYACDDSKSSGSSSAEDGDTNTSLNIGCETGLDEKPDPTGLAGQLMLEIPSDVDPCSARVLSLVRKKATNCKLQNTVNFHKRSACWGARYYHHRRVTCHLP